MVLNNKNAIPFLKWAGGKRWLTTYRDNFFPESYGTYIEPFLGSGAVFFHMNPKSSVLSDANNELIDTYTTISTDWERVLENLEIHNRKHSKDYYYQMRQKSCNRPHTKAAQFIYLNRTCWNGLYRVNKWGEFNVPIGTKTNVILDTDNFELISKRLSRAKLLAQDFEKTIDMSHKGDFIFVDPPHSET